MVPYEEREGWRTVQFEGDDPRPKVVNTGKGRVHVVLGRRPEPLPFVTPPPCSCSGPLACSCRYPEDTARRTSPPGNSFKRQSYSLEELTRLSYAFEEIEFEHRQLAEREYLAARNANGGRFRASKHVTRLRERAKENRRARAAQAKKRKVPPARMAWQTC